VQNYDYFLKLYTKYIEQVADLFAFCLLRNHFHLLIRIKSEEEILKVFSTGSDFVSKRFSDFFNAYAKSINKAYHRTGSLFQHPFGRVMITSDCQLWTVIAYIHQNPQKHRFVKDFREWRYSSYRIVLSESPTHLQRDSVLEWFGGRKQYIDVHSQWVADQQSKWFAKDDQ
jgi:hypothetical protein